MNIFHRIGASIQARFVEPWQQAHYEKTKYGKKLAAYQGKHAGQRCFIVANGPSLQTEDLDLLHARGEITFGMNRIYKLFDQTNWRPTYYVCEDELICQDHQPEINAITAQEKFIPIELNWYHGVDIQNALYFHLNYREESRYPHGFSPDIAHQIDCRGTVTCSCMQLAVYMGFTEIYLLGVDHNYRVTIDINGNTVEDPTVKDYFCEGYDADIQHLVVHDMGNNTRAYMDAKKYCDATGGKVTIYNATRGGKLEVFPRVDFDSLF